MRLSKNFWLNELIKSSTADRLDISNSPTTEHLVNLTVVTHKILQPVREKFGVITVNSGYRSPALNTKVGGSKTSQHCNGEAVDFEQLLQNGFPILWNLTNSFLNFIIQNKARIAAGYIVVIKRMVLIVRRL